MLGDAPSFYGTELETRQIEEIELVVLPAEEVIPFFADMHTLLHIEWQWDEQAAHLIRLAPVLAATIEDRKFVPSFDAFRSGRLQWSWDGASLKAQDRSALAKALEETDESFGEGLAAAYSASVFQHCYGTEETATDLRREFPQLFPQGGALPKVAPGLDAQAWLVSIGWKADAAPFRPLLQLLEPDDDSPPGGCGSYCRTSWTPPCCCRSGWTRKAAPKENGRSYGRPSSWIVPPVGWISCAAN